MVFDNGQGLFLILWLMNLAISLTNSTKYCNFRHLNGRLQGFPTGCTHIIGFLDLFLDQVDVNNEQFFNILDSIEYVSEYIHISGSFRAPRVFSMKKLRVIYGYGLHDGKYSLIFDQVHHNVTGIDFRSLTGIPAGDVGFIKNFQFCNAARMIKWSEMFSEQILMNPNQSVAHVEYPLKQFKCTEEKKNVKFNCHANCEKLDGVSYCYGPDEEQCQKRTKCRMIKSLYRENSCFIEDKRERACPNECIGGCTSQTSCNACQFASYNGKCLDRCPDGTYGLWPPLCVDKCPKMYMTWKNHCVTRCNAGHINEDGVCKECGANGCPSTCYLLDENGEHIERLNRTTLLSLRNCTRLIGSIVIDGRGFGRDVTTTVDDFMALSNLKRIEGILVFNLGGFPARLKNHEKFRSLFFLQNLEQVDGIQTFSVQQFSPGFFGTPFSYLGLKSLHKFNAEQLNFRDNKNLKYINTVKWNKLGVDKVAADKVDDLRCDEECDRDYGCWGPGPELCLRRCITKHLTIFYEKCIY